MSKKIDINFNSLNSLLSIEENIPNEVLELPCESDNPKTKNSIPYHKYLINGILDEFIFLNLDILMPHVEKTMNNLLSMKLNGKLIPDKGCFADFVTKTTAEQDIVTGRIHFKEGNVINCDFDFPINETELNSSLRCFIGLEEKAFLYSIPLKFLSSKMNGLKKNHPNRGNYWVYRLRLLIKDKEKYPELYEQFYNGYIGVSSRHAKVRLSEHFQGHKAKSNKLLYNSWAHLDEKKIDHIIMFEILDRCNSEKEMYELEEQLIKSENTLNPRGFNMIPGGKSGEKFLEYINASCPNPEFKDDYAGKLITISDSDIEKKPHFVKEYLRRYRKGQDRLIYVKGFWRCLPKEAEELLENL